MAHIAWDPGALGLARGLAQRLDAVLVHAPVSRLIYDLNRAPDMANNPYLTAALHLAAGLDGIEEQLDPGEPVNDNIYSQSRGSLATSGIQFLPPTLCHALDALEADPFAEKVLG